VKFLDGGLVAWPYPFAADNNNPERK